MNLIEETCKDSENPERCKIEVAESLRNLKDRDLNFLAFSGSFMFSARPGDSEGEEIERTKWGLEPESE